MAGLSSCRPHFNIIWQTYCYTVCIFHIKPHFKINTLFSNISKQSSSDIPKACTSHKLNAHTKQTRHQRGSKLSVCSILYCKHPVLEIPSNMRFINTSCYSLSKHVIRPCYCQTHRKLVISGPYYNDSVIRY